MHSSGYWVWRWLGRSVGPTWLHGGEDQTSDEPASAAVLSSLDRHMSMKKAWDIMHGASSFNQSKLGWIHVCSTKIMKRARSSKIHMYSYTSLIVNPIVALKIDIGSCDSGLVQHTIWKESVLQISQMQNVCKD